MSMISINPSESLGAIPCGGNHKLLLESIKGRIASYLPALTQPESHPVWKNLEFSLNTKAVSICEELIDQAKEDGLSVTADWFFERRREVSSANVPDKLYGVLTKHCGSQEFSMDNTQGWRQLAASLFQTSNRTAAEARPTTHEAHAGAVEQGVAERKEPVAVAVPVELHSANVHVRQTPADCAVADAGMKRNRDEFERDLSDTAEERDSPKLQTPKVKEDPADESGATAGGRMRAEEHRRRQINSEMLNALRAELPERDRAAFTGGNNSTVNTLSHAIDFIHKLKEKKAKCAQELAMLDGADMGVLAQQPSAPTAAQSVASMGQPAALQSGLPFPQFMPQLAAPSPGLDVFAGLALPQQGVQPQPNKPQPSHRMAQYLKISQVSAMTVECSAFSNTAWLPIGNVPLGQATISVHENNSLCGRIMGEIPVPFATVLRRLQERDWHQCVPDWSPCTVHASSAVELVGPGTGVYRTTLSAPSVSNSVLEICQIRHVMASTTVQGRLMLAFTSTAHDSPPLQPGAEPAQMNPSGCILEASADGTGCKIVVLMDLGPGWGASEGLVQQLLRSNYTATAHMAMGLSQVGTMPSQPSYAAPAPVLLNTAALQAAFPPPLAGGPAGLAVSQGPDRFFRSNSFPSLCLGSGSGHKEGLGWEMVEGTGVRTELMDMMKLAGKKSDQLLPQPDQPPSALQTVLASQLR